MVVKKTAVWSVLHFCRKSAASARFVDVTIRSEVVLESVFVTTIGFLGILDTLILWEESSAHLLATG